ncbi:MAG TPA: ribosomal L7Ae/L30e/S12e/Gadd45 family protein [Gemmatimonadales bacterium]|jgi:ribosomal protein L7Ae-like RNA K-turn-binding protein|nr:ribosomal L7Ae/L30e/S12e/Gadd45 family protein [Gemmatimonadales bacterium]
MERLLGLLGLGMRARQLVVGVDAVRRALQADEVRCVVMAADAGPRAAEKVVRLARGRGVPLVPGPAAEMLGARLGRPAVMAVGIRDRALADGVLRSAGGSP